jgi:DNA-binding CsgD family transcriptional regulator
MNDRLNEMFENASVEDLVRGYAQEAGGDCRCLFCGAVFDAGLVHPVAGGYALAARACVEHLALAHGGPFEALLSLGAPAVGLSEIQERVLRLQRAGKSDREIAAELGGKSESTIRNHRFNLRKKAAEARAFVAVMRLMEESGEAPAERFIAYHMAMPTKDERAAVTESEAAAIEARCLRRGASGGLEIAFWPRKQKEKLVVLRAIAALFERGRSYSEPEVNELLMPVFHDHVTIRRYLIEYCFLDRRPDGSAYWKP